MKKTLWIFALAGILLTDSMAQSTPIEAELIMPGGRSWKGMIVGRDGDWLKFSTGRNAKPIRLGISTIQELNFKVDVDAEKLSEMMKNREFDRIISALSRTLKPFAEYSDVPSNLTKYNSLLMELHYKVGEYDQSLAMSSKIANDDRNPALQEKARIYQALALIDSGQSAAAEALLSQYGWDQDISDEAPPEKLFITAKLMVLQEKYNRAMELVSKVIAFNSQDPDWMQPAEMLCAEVYVKLGMYDSAEEVCREIGVFYKNSDESDQALELKEEIDRLRAEQELEQDLKTDEA